jgi:hypothetical protein
MSYRSLLDAHVLPRSRGVEIRRLEHGQVAAWTAVVASASSPSTTRKAVGVLRSILDLAVRDHRIAANPALGVTLPRPPASEQRFRTAAELDRGVGEASEGTCLGPAVTSGGSCGVLPERACDSGVEAASPMSPCS